MVRLLLSLWLFVPASVPASVSAQAGARLAEPVAEASDWRPPETAPPRRSVGLGTAIGAGLVSGRAYAPGGRIGYLSPAVELPSLEALFFLDEHVSLDLSIPLLNTIVQVAIDGVVVFATNVALDFNVGDDWVRFVVGPTLGAIVFADRGNVGPQIAIGAVLGVELLTPRRDFGFRIMTRPQVQIAIPTDVFLFQVGGMGMIELCFVGYVD